MELAEELKRRQSELRHVESLTIKFDDIKALLRRTPGLNGRSGMVPGVPMH